MAGISSKALSFGSPNNTYKFNGGSDLEEDESINLYSTFFREYDPQLGRFSGVDLLGEQNLGISPYHFALNNPISLNDPTGLKEAYRYDWGPTDAFINEVRGSYNNAFYISPGDGPYANYYNALWNSVPEDGAVTYGGGQPSGSTSTLYRYTNESGSGTFITPKFHGLGWYFDTGMGERYRFVTSVTFMHNELPSGQISSASFFSGDISGTDLINVGLGLGGQMLNQLQVNLMAERGAVLSKAEINGFNSFYRRELATLDNSIGKLGKYSKQLGWAGVVLQAGNLGLKYVNGEGITKKDLFDTGVSVILTAIAISNPVGLLAVGLYGLFDSMGAFDGIKRSIGINDDVIIK